MMEETTTEAQGTTSAAPEEEPKNDMEAIVDSDDVSQDDGSDKDEPREPRLRRRGRSKVSYLTINKIYSVDYKDVGLLKRFLTDRGKILPRRQTGNTAKQQRMISRAIKRAREMALLPFVVSNETDDGMGRRTRRSD